MNSFGGTFALTQGGRRAPAESSARIKTASIERLAGPSYAIDDGRMVLTASASTAPMTLFTDGVRTLLMVDLNHADASGATSVASATALLEGLSAKPEQTLRALRGPFVILYADSERGDLLLATDRAATRPPCYAQLHDRIVVGLTAGDVERAAGTGVAVRPQAIYDYLYFHMIPAPGTMFERVHRLQPGQYLHLQHGVARVASYWRPDYASPPVSKTFPAAKAEFRELLRRAVEARIGIGKTGSFLSGGTDSSTLAGVLREVSGQAPDTYSIGFDVDGFDEISYARIAASHFGARHHVYYMKPGDLLASMPALAASYDQPFGNSSAVAVYRCALLARNDGVDCLLGGDGGDELFGGNTRYAKQKVFAAYGGVPRWLARGLIEPALLRPDATWRVPVIKKMRSYVEQALIPMPARMQSYNLLTRIGADRILQPAFLAAIDPRAPSLLEEHYFAESSSTGLVNRMLHFDWKFTLADNDLPKVVGACDLAGVGVGFPLLDERIVDFANALPADWKLKGLRLRHFFKRALNDFLPPAVIAKKKHGFGLPFGEWLVADQALRQLALGSLESIRDRGIVQPRFVDDLMRARLAQHATFYGEMVWILVMLELWLQAHRPAYRFN